MATKAATPIMMEEMKSSNRERFRLLSRHAMVNSHAAFKLVPFICDFVVKC